MSTSSSRNSSRNPSTLTSNSDLRENYRQILGQKDVASRQWFFAKIDKILDINSPSSQSVNSNVNPTIKNVTVVFGQAATGKTFLMQMLVARRPVQERILLPFFCQAIPPSNSLADFTASLAHQIETTFGVVIENPSCDKTQFRDSFLIPLSTLSSDDELVEKLHLNEQRFLLIIDSIDLRPDICELLAENHHYLPQWLHVVITARPKRYRVITKLFSGARKVALDDIKKSNVYDDLFDYLVEHKTDLMKSIDETPATANSKLITKELLNRLIAKSNGSILYLKLLVKSLAEGIFSLDNLDVVGATLNGIFLALFIDLFNKYPQYENEFRQVLSCLNRANNFKCHEKNLQDYCALEEDEFLELLEALASHYLVTFEKASGTNDSSIVKLVHPTLYEWLSDVKHCTERFLCHNETSDDGERSPTRSKQPQFVSHKFIDDQSDSENVSRSKKIKQNGGSTNGVPANQFENIEDEELQSETGQRIEITEVDLSVQEVSKEFLEKLQAKFESALQQSDLKTLRSILQKYAQVLVDKSFIGGKTPLYWAIKKSNIKMVELFIEFGADVNGVCDVERWSYTPLVIALIQNSYEICELLLDNDADVDLAMDSLPPLANAITFACSPEIVRLLLYWGAGTDFLDDSGRSLLHFAAYEPRTWPETIGLLLTVGCDEMHRDNIGQTALHVAAQNGSIGNVEVLVEIGGDKLIHTIDKAGQLPLHIAISSSNDHLVAPLLTNKSINALAHDGNSPLRLAVLNYNLEMAQMLIGRGADVNYRDADGRSIVYCVVAFAHSTLENKGPPFFNAFTLNRAGPEEYLRTVVKTLEFLVRFGADLELKDLEGRTPLHVAAWQGAPTIVDSLIALGALVDALDSEGRTPLHMCAWNGHISVVRLLVEARAFVGQVSSTQGATPLLVAAQQGHVETCRFLVRVGGSNVTHRDLYGRDARDVALNCAHTEIVTLIDRFLSDSKAGLIPQAQDNVKMSKYDSRFYNSNPVPPNHHPPMGAIGHRSGSSLLATANTSGHPLGFAVGGNAGGGGSLSVGPKNKKTKSSGISKLSKILNP